MIIVMLGAQGTGKGTVAGLLQDKLGIPQVSTGDIFRKDIKEKTPLGIEADKYISQGNLVPDEITVPMVANRLNAPDAKKGVILDGFPRTMDQAKKLDEILEKYGKKVDLVISLTTPREEIIERILNRRVCSNQDCKTTYNLVLSPSKVEGICDKCGSPLIQRKDDTSEEAIKRRLAIYDEITSPLIGYYKDRGVVREEEISVRVNKFAKEAVEDVVNYLKETNQI